MRKIETNLLDAIQAYTKRLESGETIDGTELAGLVARIAKHEVREGGPYARREGGRTDPEASVAIAYFLVLQGVRLPRLDAYVATRMGNCRSALERELLGRYEAASRNVRPIRTATFTKEEKRIVLLLKRFATDRFAPLERGLKERAHAVLDRTIKGNPDKQMTLMPLFVRQALGKKGERFSDEYVARLGLGNALFWSAFIVYDDFWDEDEAAEPRSLPAANLFERHYTDFFTHLLPERTGFRSYFERTMDALDGANSWEIAHCRMAKEGERRILPERLPAYGDFGIKFFPAAGHVFGPVAMFLELGYGLRSREVRSLVSYFTHYLVAMQINDDLHDWKEDLERGHISTVVWLLLKEWRRVHPDRRQIDVTADMHELERLFWYETLVPACEMVRARCARSRRALSSMRFISDPAPLEAFILRNESAASEAIAAQERSVAFLGAIS